MSTFHPFWRPPFGPQLGEDRPITRWGNFCLECQAVLSRRGKCDRCGLRNVSLVLHLSWCSSCTSCSERPHLGDKCNRPLRHPSADFAQTGLQQLSATEDATPELWRSCIRCAQALSWNPDNADGPGWYEDPASPETIRMWDGMRWTFITEQKPLNWGSLPPPGVYGDPLSKNFVRDWNGLFWLQRRRPKP